MRGKQQVVTTESISVNKEATVFQAEAVAIEKAAKFLIDHSESRDKYIRIFSDSQAVLRALDKEGVTSQTILNTKSALYELKQIKQAVTLKWTKAHIGIDGNELADEYTKLGATAEHNTQKLPITKNEINKRIEEKCLDLSLIHI